VLRRIFGPKRDEVIFRSERRGILKSFCDYFCGGGGRGQRTESDNIFALTPKHIISENRYIVKFLAEISNF
jgi:hypothetical protein